MPIYPYRIPRVGTTPVRPRVPPVSYSVPRQDGPPTPPKPIGQQTIPELFGSALRYLLSPGYPEGDPRRQRWGESPDEYMFRILVPPPKVAPIVPPDYASLGRPYVAPASIPPPVTGPAVPPDFASLGSNLNLKPTVAPIIPPDYASLGRPYVDPAPIAPPVTDGTATGAGGPWPGMYAGFSPNPERFRPGGGLKQPRYGDWRDAAADWAIRHGGKPEDMFRRIEETYLNKDDKYAATDPYSALANAQSDDVWAEAMTRAGLWSSKPEVNDLLWKEHYYAKNMGGRDPLEGHGEAIEWLKGEAENMRSEQVLSAQLAAQQLLREAGVPGYNTGDADFGMY